jgi:nitrogen fixation protein NifU and related proteins
VSDLRELYQEVILDHSKRPRNFRALPEADRSADGYNPLCGDRATVFVKMEGDRLSDLAFQGSGCSISTASASMMTEALKGKSRGDAEALFDRFHRLVTSDPSQASRNAAPELGKLTVFAGVCEFPVRVKCASLPWHTLKAALEGDALPVSTEVSESSSGDGGGHARSGSKP